MPIHPSSGNQTGKPSALLIAPTAFYSFAENVAQGLRDAGYGVTIANDEYPSNIGGKILGKLGIRALLRAITYRVLLKEFVADKCYSVAVIIKGRGIGKKLLRELRGHADKVVAYNWDSFGFNPAPLAWISDVTKYATFDYADAVRYGLQRVDLYSSLPPKAEKLASRFDVSAILRVHSGRLHYIDMVLKAVKPERSFLYIFELNVFTFVLNFLHSPLLYIKYWRHIHFKALPYAEYVQVLLDSEFTVDYAHPLQTGITIRCFEALSAGTKLITNNPCVLQNPMFGEENVIVFRAGGDPEKLRACWARLLGKYPMRLHREISHFISDLLDVGASSDEPISTVRRINDSNLEGIQ